MNVVALCFCNQLIIVLVAVCTACKYADRCFIARLDALGDCDPIHVRRDDYKRSLQVRLDF